MYANLQFFMMKKENYTGKLLLFNINKNRVGDTDIIKKYKYRD